MNAEQGGGAVIILPEDKEIMSYLSDEDAKLVLLAIFSEPDDEPDLSVAARIAYSVVRNKSERISKKQSENGRKGGRPPKPTETQDNPNKPSVSVSDTVSEDKAVVVDAHETKSGDFAKIAERFAASFGYFLPQAAQVKIQDYLAHMDVDVIFDAIGKADDPSVEKKWPYIDSILAPRKAAGIKTMDAVRRVEAERAASKATGNRGWRKNGPQTPAEHPKAPDAAELARMEKLLKQIKGDTS